VAEQRALEKEYERAGTRFAEKQQKYDQALMEPDELKSPVKMKNQQNRRDVARKGAQEAKDQLSSASERLNEVAARQKDLILRGEKLGLSADDVSEIMDDDLSRRIDAEAGADPKAKKREPPPRPPDGGSGPPPKGRLRQLADKVVAALGPKLKKLAPVAGPGLGLASAKAEFGKGNYFSAGLDAVGIIPGVGDLVDAGRLGVEFGLIIDQELGLGETALEWWGDRAADLYDAYAVDYYASRP
jgi:hypothetical protein